MFFPIANLLRLIPISFVVKANNQQFKKSKTQFTKTGHNEMPLVISIIGIIPKDIFWNLKVAEARIFPPIYYRDCFFFVSTFNDKLTISTRICDLEKNKELIELYFDLVIEELNLVIS